MNSRMKQKQRSRKGHAEIIEQRSNKPPVPTSTAKTSVSGTGSTPEIRSPHRSDIVSTPEKRSPHHSDIISTPSPPPTPTDPYDVTSCAVSSVDQWIRNAYDCCGSTMAYIDSVTAASSRGYTYQSLTTTTDHLYPHLMDTVDKLDPVIAAVWRYQLLRNHSDLRDGYTCTESVSRDNDSCCTLSANDNITGLHCLTGEVNVTRSCRNLSLL